MYEAKCARMDAESGGEFSGRKRTQPPAQETPLEQSLVVSYAVQTRYPGDSVTKNDARQAIKLCREFRKEARRALGVR